MLDATALNRRVDLPALIADLRPSGAYHIGPCPFCGGEDRFNVKRTDGGDLWLCRHCAPDKYRDATAFLMRRDGLTFKETLARYGDAALPLPAPARRSAATRPPAPLEQPPPAVWQRAARAAVDQATAYLWSDRKDAASVRRYLTAERGLSEATIRAAGLGYNPAWCTVANAGRLPPGVVIPSAALGALWYVTVRTTETARAESAARGYELKRYQALRGSVLKSFYRADLLPTADTVLIVEGEFDALLLAQCAPPGVAVVTMGGAGMFPGPLWLALLARAVARGRVLVLMDGDQAGQNALDQWRRLIPRIEVAPPLPGGGKDACGKDATDAWRAGVDLGAWLTGVLTPETASPSAGRPSAGRPSAGRPEPGSVVPTCFLNGSARVIWVEPDAGRCWTSTGLEWGWEGQRLTMPPARSAMS